MEEGFLTFQNNMITRYGEEYAEQVDVFFQRAVTLANSGLLESALQDLRFARDLMHYSNDKSVCTLIYGLMAQMHCDLGQIKQASSCYDLGLSFLDVNDEAYFDEVETYQRLKESIDRRSRE